MRQLDSEKSIADELIEQKNETKKKERFLRTRMWISTLMSLFFNDRGVIPPNIGNNVLVTNNVVLTKNSLTAYIQIREFSEATYEFFFSDLVKTVKARCPGIYIDITVKLRKYYPDCSKKSGGIRSREQSWTAILNNPLSPPSMARRAAQCLYSLEVARSGVSLYKGRTYIKVHARDNTTLRNGVKEVMNYLNSMDCAYKRVNSNLEEHVEYVGMLSDRAPQHLKDFPAQVYSLATLAECMPVTQGMNDTTGTLLGYDMQSGYPYCVDFRSTANAKNIMIEAQSGFGKTFIVEYWLYPFWADGYNLCLMDIKGNEFVAITKALNGIILSLRNSATQYPNTFVWDKEMVTDGDYGNYASSCKALTREWLMILCNLEESEVPLAEAFMDEALSSYYITLGAMERNPNTWTRTRSIDPFTFYQFLVRFTSLEIRKKYSVAALVVDRLAIFLAQGGSYNYMFSEPFRMSELLATKILTFDFGILDAATIQNPAVFKYHVFCMKYINNAFVSSKKSRGEWTVKVLEESQIVGDYLLSIYAHEMTMRRSQNQITILLGNSIAALANNPVSRPLLENINLMVLGHLNNSSRTYLTKEYGLSDLHEELLERIQKDTAMLYTFLMINRMEKNATTALLQAPVSDAVRNSSLFRVVDTEE